MTELERLRKQNAELLEWNRYYLEVTKERRKQVEELQAEVERLREIVLPFGEFEYVTSRNDEAFDLMYDEYMDGAQRKAEEYFEKHMEKNELLYCEYCSAVYHKRSSIGDEVCGECLDFLSDTESEDEMIEVARQNRLGRYK